METETELSYQPKRRVKRHSRSRSRSRSPETNRNRRLPVELRRHLQFGLVEPPADPSADLQYTRVTTEHKMPRIRYAAKRSQKGGSVDGRSETSEPPLSVADPPQDTTTDRALPPTAAYPAVSAAYPSTAAAYPSTTATYTAPGVPYQSAGVPHPPPSAAPQSARSAAPGHQGRTPAGERVREATARTGRESSPAAIGSGQTRLTSGQVTLPADSPYDNSDSGLGNESPTEFTRLSAQASLQNGVGASRAMTSHGEPRVVRTLDTMTSL
ncbi:hypothetical protein FJT64_002095 [Amphibalanus amphitrite]|uniref:Uncharacterized protein n=1 Tax=Amphibalanus amphitrite TaxID=1232801 RepID=A0A6A4WZM6_AMPAM|nr:hypothetical protein FJT64_002095 [Amphibalanus amphitrite]